MVRHRSVGDALGLLREGGKVLGFACHPAVLDRFSSYLVELKRWNSKINLTGLKTDQDIIIKLFLDSLALLPFLGESQSLADLGAGAGFPGLVLKIAQPSLALTLVESRGKKAAFLEYVASVLKLTGVEVAAVALTPRLADAWGPRFQAVTSRAAWALPRLVALAAPLLMPGGLLLAPKGPRLDDAELQAVRKAAAAQGLSPPELREYQVPFLNEPRLLVMAKKPK
jgi:16S rRNA (guanine527-N7)-methyltransferase